MRNFLLGRFLVNVMKKARNNFSEVTVHREIAFEICYRSSLQKLEMRMRVYGYGL